MTTAVDSRTAFTHEALFYRDEDDFLGGVAPFVLDGLSVDAAVFVAVPGPRRDALRATVAGAANDVRFADMTELGRNPGRIMGAVRRFADDHPARPIRFVGEPIWPGRTPAEITEATRHEALLNVAFAGTDTAILCPYDASRLDQQTITDATSTHPHLLIDAEHRHNPAYRDPTSMLAADHPLTPEAPVDAAVMHFARDDLAALRRLVERYAAEAGIVGNRADDLILAANEVATNAVEHASGRGTIRVWADSAGVNCELSDDGLVSDPLVGRMLPPVGALRGRGLWIVNQTCDLVRMRFGPNGVVVRLQMGCG